MTIVPEPSKTKVKLTPELLIEAPRRSAATPNAKGTLALFTVSTYSLDAHVETKEIRILNISDGSSVLFSNNAADKNPQWLGDEDEVFWLRDGKDESGETEIWVGGVGGEKGSYLAGTVPSTITEVQNFALSPSTIAFAFGAPTTPKGELLNPKKAPKPLHTAREYSSHPFRFWDTWLKPYRSSLYYTVFEKTQTSPGKKWKLSSTIVNALKGTKLQFPHVPNALGSEGGSYAISPTGILLQAIIPDLNLAQRFGYEIYYIPLRTFQEEKPPKPKGFSTPPYKGSQYAPAFTLDGQQAAFLVNKDRDNEMSSPVAIYVLRPDFVNATTASVGTLFAWEHEELKERTWDRRPDALIWGNDSKTLYLVANDVGYHRLFKFPFDIVEEPPVRAKELSFKIIPMPQRLTTGGSVASVSTLNRVTRDTAKMFVSTSSILESSLYAWVDPETASVHPISSASEGGQVFGFNAKQLTEINVKGVGPYEVQAWVIRPSDFDPSKKYPLALLIHGGPQSSWSDAWSTRWNPAAFAEQGYVVVAPNPTGSTGFGDEFQAGVEGDWGGRPYEDIVKCFEHVEEHLDYVDTSNAVALGGSYGGYMVNWIAGQPLAKKLKAIVSHDGIFTHMSMMASDIVGGYDRDVGGTLWDRTDLWYKSSPASYTDSWSTPMLVIHSDNDFRCPISEGMAVFNTCRAKGIESRFLNFPDETHFVLARENSLKWHHTVLGWINKFTGVQGGVVLEDPSTEPRFDDV